MLKLVESGYRPSAKDNNRYIGFLTFINRLAEFSGFDEEILIKAISEMRISSLPLAKADLDILLAR